MAAGLEGLKVLNGWLHPRDMRVIFTFTSRQEDEEKSAGDVVTRSGRRVRNAAVQLQETALATFLDYEDELGMAGHTYLLKFSQAPRPLS